MITLNGISATDLGLILTEGQPLVAGFSRSRESIALPGMSGLIPSPNATISPKVLRFSYYPSATMNAAQRTTMLQRLTSLLTGLVEVQWGDTARRISGVVQTIDANVASPSFANIAPTITVEIHCFDGAMEDVEPQQLLVGSFQTRVPVGTVGHHVEIIVAGANSTPFAVVYRDFRGVERGRILCNPALLTNETLIINTQSQEFIRYNTAGVGISMPSWDGGTTWPEFLPSHAQRELGAWATLEAPIYVGCTYRRKWEN
ncbi:MAG: hypothetical protein ACO1Q7_02160 [Gemmatimonas sp.]